MCLAVPMTVIRIDGQQAVVEQGGVKTSVSAALAPDIMIGDKVIVHAGFIIEKLNEEEARLIDEAWDEYAKANAT